MHVLDYYFSKKNNYAFSNKNYKLEKLVIKKALFYDDISTSTLRAMRAQTPFLLTYLFLIDFYMKRPIICIASNDIVLK